MGLVGRKVETPYIIPEATRQAQAERRREMNVRRKAAGNYQHTEETKAKLSQTTSLAIAEGRIPRVSGLEMKVGDVLQRLGVPCVHQYYLRGPNGRYGTVLDYFLPEMGAALEFNGTLLRLHEPRRFERPCLTTAFSRRGRSYWLSCDDDWFPSGL